MATETVYIKYEEAVLIHFALMRTLGESRYGVDHRDLIESALARPQNSAVYANADIIRQSATLLFGLIKIIRGVEATNEPPQPYCEDS